MSHMPTEPTPPILIARNYNAAESEMSKLGREIYWITPDFRTYESVHLSDGSCWLELDADTVVALFELYTNVEFFAEDVEGCFTKLVQDAKEFEASFQKLKVAMGYKPLRQKKF